jgi:hypothetical protein
MKKKKSTVKNNSDTNKGENKKVEMDRETQSASSAQLSENQSSTSSKRQAGVGIKHFYTNRIHLRSQKEYLDNGHCVFIVPIMSHQDVKNWKGSGYSAIVLVRYTTYLDGNKEVDEEKQKKKKDVKDSDQTKDRYDDMDDKKKALIATVYRHIEADTGHIIFATNEECNTACALLRTFVLCICRSSRDAFTEEFLASKFTALNKKASEPNEMAATYIKHEQKNCPVPKCKESSTTCHVRKITFSNSNKENENPAPDPALLLGKAASNWLKCHKMVVLPACVGDDDSSSSFSSSISSRRSSDSGFVASFKQEMVVRGWSSDMFEQSLTDDITEVGCQPGETVDEPLSDDDA